MVKIENKQPNIKVRIAVSTDSHAMCDIPGDITRLRANFTQACFTEEMSRRTCSMTIVLIGFILGPLGPRNHNKNTTSFHYRRLALQRNRAMYIAASVFGHDVSYFLRTLETAA